MLLTVKIKKLNDNAKLPTRGSLNAAGADLYACLEDPVVQIHPHKTVKIPLGFASEFTPGYEAQIRARSGISYKKSLAPINEPGTIDADYRGEWAVLLHNYSDSIQIVEHGERVAQVVFSEIETPAFDEVEELDETERGDGGFGSTGTK